MEAAKPIAIDLFCGVGGMSLGFRQAGFDVRAAFDCESRHVAAYNLNFGEAAAVEADLRKSSGAELLKHAGLAANDVDVVFGGPPCQGFSVGGTRDLDDPRNELVFDFSRLVREISPQYFVMENVAGLLQGHAKKTLASFIRRVRLAGYDVVEPVRLLNAADYGVPQRRHRVFILGHKKSLLPPEYPEPMPLRDDTGRVYFPTVRDAIADLPNVDRIPELLRHDGFIGQLAQASHYARLMRCEMFEDDDSYRPTKARVRKLTGCLRTSHTQDVVQRFRKTKQGSAEPISRYFRLAFSGVAPTLRAGTGDDHGRHTAPRPIHPSRPRCITVREGARLHGFPDWFRFDNTRWHAFRQIGNSVPPRMARQVAKALHQLLIAEINDGRY